MDQTPVIPNQSTKPIDDSEKTGKDRFKDIREQVINDLEKNIIENREFNESRILRNSALNRFEAKLSDSEAIKLNTIGEKLKKICT
jgi:hypothetical protein